MRTILFIAALAAAIPAGAVAQSSGSGILDIPLSAYERRMTNDERAALNEWCYTPPERGPWLIRGDECYLNGINEARRAELADSAAWVNARWPGSQAAADYFCAASVRWNQTVSQRLAECHQEAAAKRAAMMAQQQAVAPAEAQARVDRARARAGAALACVRGLQPLLRRPPTLAEIRGCTGATE